MTEEKVSDAFTGALLESLSRFQLTVRTLMSTGVRGEKRSRRKGSSSEYADHREYVHGDDLRRLDWHALARLDTMLIRLYAAEETLPLEVVIDTSASMDFGDPTKFVTAARVGCCLSQIALLHSTPVQWRVPSLEPVRLSGRNDLPRILHMLDDLIPDGEASPATELRMGTLKGPKKRSVVVLTDGYASDELQPALRAARSSGAEVYFVMVLSPEEINPSLRGAFTFIDAETGLESSMTVDRGSMKKYNETLAAFRADWHQFCRSHGIQFVEVPSDTPIDATLFRTLTTAGLIS